MTPKLPVCSFINQKAAVPRAQQVMALHSF